MHTILAYRRRAEAVETMRRISALAALAAAIVSGGTGAWAQAKDSAAAGEGLALINDVLAQHVRRDAA